MAKFLDPKFLSRLWGRKQPRAEQRSIFEVFSSFRRLLDSNNQILDLMTGMGDKLGGDYIFDTHYIHTSCQEIASLVYKLIHHFNFIAQNRYPGLDDAFWRINTGIHEMLEGKSSLRPDRQCTIADTFITSDLEEQVGAKNVNLAQLKNVLGLNVPDGFAVTSSAFHWFLAYNGLDREIESLTAQWKENQISAKKASGEIRARIDNAAVPPGMKKEIQKALKKLAGWGSKRKLRLAVRSSAVGEDGKNSFAGQYTSCINTCADDFFKNYKTVVSSAYSREAMAYREANGFEEHEMAMAVGCLEMIQPKVSGVLYTLNPVRPEENRMKINAALGLGAPLVSGRADFDNYDVERDAPHKIFHMTVGDKKQWLVALPHGGVDQEDVPEGLQAASCLTQDQIARLAEIGIMVERYFRAPQDIEFSIDASGKIWILQSRPLNIKEKMSRMVCDIPKIKEKYDIVFSGKGMVAQDGIAIGKVFLYEDGRDLDDFPSGAILVTRHASPKFAMIAKYAAGIITDIGSPAGHMATIAREFRVPTLVDTGIATSKLKQGQEITLDTEGKVVYDGSAKALCYYVFADDNFADTYEYRLLKRVLKRISPLTFVDPEDKRFSPRFCQTFHDITRFVHEKAVEELINLNYYDLKHERSRAQKLKVDIPLDLLLIDIGEGLAPGAGTRAVLPRQITSVPLNAFLKGLTRKGMWNSEPMSVDFKSFMSSLTRTQPPHQTSPGSIGQNLVVMSNEYINISLRLGYHFNMIDAYMGPNPNDNYIYFRFFGGVTDAGRRTRRVSFLAQVLEKAHFRMKQDNDLLVAKTKKMSWERMEESLCLVGELVAFTRQLDVKMLNDTYVKKYVDDFWALSLGSD